MKNRSEVVPLYGGSSLWEIGRDIETEYKPTRDDLVRLLKEPETVYCFTPERNMAELRSLTGLALPLIKSVGKENLKVVLFSNQNI